MNFKYCIDREYLESALALGFIPGVDNYDDIIDTVLRKYIEERSQESKDSLNLVSLNAIISDGLEMDMTDRNAKSRIEPLFFSYQKLLRRNV